MTRLESLRTRLPEPAKDTKLNLQAVLERTVLSPEQRWGVAIASAIATHSGELREALVADALKEVDPAVVDDAIAAATLMAMNNVYYRFRHMVGEAYAQKPARLRMNRLIRPAGSKVDFELMCLAVSAINGCETCVVSHERAVLEGGLGEDHVHDAVRIAATLQAAAVALEAESLLPVRSATGGFIPAQPHQG